MPVPCLQLARHCAVCKYWHESDFSTWVVSGNIKKVHKIVLADRKLKLRQLAGTLKISGCSEFTILHEHLSMKKLFSKWVPRLLTVMKNTRSCISLFGNRSGGPRKGHRARPRVADRGALYRGLLLNTDTKLNKQSRTMFQGWSRMNNRPPCRVLRPYPCMRGSAGADRILP